MALNKLTLRPLAEGFSYGDRPEVLAVELDGGLPRLRRDIIGAAMPASASWRCGGADLATWEAFYDSNKAGPFLLDLLIGGTWRECTCSFVPGSRKVTDFSGDLVLVSVELRVHT